MFFPMTNLWLHCPDHHFSDTRHLAGSYYDCSVLPYKGISGDAYLVCYLLRMETDYRCKDRALDNRCGGIQPMLLVPMDSWLSISE